LKSLLNQRKISNLESNDLKRISRIISYIFIGLTITLMLVFNLIGSNVNSKGVLEEPFYLIPLAYTSFIIGIIFLVISLLKKN
jgi:preprotein translocase subunit SecG